MMESIKCSEFLKKANDIVKESGYVEDKIN